MAKAYYVKFETPEELVSPILEALRVSATSGKVVRGTNEATKAIERGISKLIIIAEDKLLSAIEASVSCVDWVEVNGTTSQLKISNVDSPLLIISALGENKYFGLKVFWVDQDKNNYQVNFIDEEKWEIISSSTNPIELSSNADIFISPLGLDNQTYEDKLVKKFNIAEKKLEVLNSGVEVRENWQEIYDFFARCLVKSSAESRASGAGAGLVDTD